MKISQLILEAANVRQGQAIQDRSFTRFSGSTTQAKRIKQASESSQERARKAGSFRIVDGADDGPANNSNARVNFRLVPDENVHTQHGSNNIPALFGSKGVDVVTRGGKLDPTRPIIVKPQSHKAHSSSHQTFALPSASDKRVYNVPISELTKTGSKIGAEIGRARAVGAAIGGAIGGAAIIGKELHDRHQANKSILNQAKAFTGKHGKKVAAGTLAALGAGIGVKALLKHLRKKKVQE